MRLINRIIPGEYRYPTITPFTIPDGHTYLKTLEILVRRMKQIIDEIDENNVELFDLVVEVLNSKIDEINNAFTEFEGEVDDKLASVDTKISELETFVNAAISTLESTVNSEISDMVTYVNDSVQQIINNSIELQDTVLAGIITDDDSESRIELDSIIAENSHVVVGARYLKADGTDDSAGWVAAIAEATSSGKVLVLPPGIIALPELQVVSLSSKALTIRGSGMGVTIIRSIATEPQGGILHFSGGATNRLTLSDLTVDGDGKTIEGDAFAALIRVAGRNEARTILRRVEVKNSTSRGIGVYLSAIDIEDCWVHDCVSEGITVPADRTTNISNNLIEECSDNGIRLGTGASSGPFEGVLVKVVGNQIRNITGLLGGSGEYGNGIIAYRARHVLIANNTIKNVEWSAISCANTSKVAIVGNVCAGNTQPTYLIYVELGASECVVANNQIEGDNAGISIANANVGLVGAVVSGNSVSTGNVAIHCECGLVVGNYIDCSGTGLYAIRQVHGGLSLNTQLTVSGNHIAGAKYALGLPIANSNADSFTEVIANRVTRKDANWSSFFGAIDGTVQDVGDGSNLITYHTKMFVDQPTENVPTAEMPEPMRAGSRILIDNVLSVSDGSAWVSA